MVSSRWRVAITHVATPAVSGCRQHVAITSRNFGAKRFLLERARISVGDVLAMSSCSYPFDDLANYAMMLRDFARQRQFSTTNTALLFLAGSHTSSSMTPLFSPQGARNLAKPRT